MIYSVLQLVPPCNYDKIRITGTETVYSADCVTNMLKAEHEAALYTLQATFSTGNPVLACFKNLGTDKRCAREWQYAVERRFSHVYSKTLRLCLQAA